MLMVPVGYEMALVDTVWNTSAPLDMQLSLGRRFPMKTTAVGHAIMAYWPPEEIEKALGREAAKDLEEEFAQVRELGGLAFVRDFVPGGSAIGATIAAVAKECGVKTGILVHPTRLACCGNPAGPSLYHLIAILGKERVLKRIDRALERFG